MSTEATGHHFRLVLVAEVSKAIIHQWMSPALPYLPVLPPPSDARQKCGIFLWTGTSLYETMTIRKSNKFKFKTKEYTQSNPNSLAYNPFEFTITRSDRDTSYYIIQYSTHIFRVMRNEISSPWLWYQH